MNKTVKNVFMLIGLLVLIFIAWQLVFNDGGIVRTMYNAVAKGINGQWKKVSGNNDLLPIWKSGTQATTNGQGFDIGTGAKNTKNTKNTP